MSGSPLFGRRRTGDEGPARPVVPVAPSVPSVTMQSPLPAQSTSDSLTELRTLALQQLDPAAAAALSPERLSPEIEKLVADIATERRIQLNAREQRQLASELVNDMLGLGPLQPLLDDDGIADIMVNGPERVFIEKAGRVTLSNVKFRDAQHVANICQRIASAVGRRIDESSPMVDARLLDGSRVNIVFPPLALDGPYISIRKFTRRKIDFARLVAYGSLTAQVARVLEIAGRSRLNMIISGGTGSGKTTLLNALSRMIDPAERVITIEDAAELQLQQPHVVRMETRPPSLEGKGEVTQRDLVKNALRMRPERIIIGEVRGGEAFDMLQAMNTGHDGSMSTIHANNTRDALTRIENMVQMGNMGLPSKAIKTQIVGAVDIILQVERHRDGGRRVTQVTDVVGLEGDVVILNDLFQFEFTGETAEGRLSGTYKMGRGRPSFWERLVYFGMDRAWVAAMEETNW
jgi:pilus assembly protein CpaF